jgi:hypothetical protein
VYETNFLGRLNDEAVQRIAEKLIKPLRDWSAKNRLSSAELTEKNKDAGRVEKLTNTLQAALTSAAGVDFDGLREAIESASSGIQKDHPVWQLIQDVLPWADRNKNWIDLLAKANRMLDAERQGRFEHARQEIYDNFDRDGGPRHTRARREAVTNTFLKPDLSALLHGDHPFTQSDILNALRSRTALQQMKQTVLNQLDHALSQTPRGQTLKHSFLEQTDGLSTLMIEGIAYKEQQMMNTWNIASQVHLPTRDMIQLNNTEEVAGILSHLGSLQALEKTDKTVIDKAMEIMEYELSRGTPDNGFAAMLGIHGAFKTSSSKLLFDDNPHQQMKGYVAELFDEEIDIEVIEDTPEERARMKEGGWKLRKKVERARFDPGEPRLLYSIDRGVGGYNASIIGLRSRQHMGTSMFDSMRPGSDSKRAARRTHRKIDEMRNKSFDAAHRQMTRPSRLSGTQVIPIVDENGHITDYRYIMSEAEKKSILKKRDYFDEVLPRMMASITDKLNTLEINSEAVELMYEEWRADRKNPDVRFVEVGKDADTKNGRDMWNLMPMETKLHMREAFSGDVFYLRDDVVNTVLGFRKFSLADGKWLGPTAPVVRAAEKVWQEAISYIRFKIAVLKPQVVVGNMASNAAILASEGIPAEFIKENVDLAIRAMHNFQKDTRKRDQLEVRIGSYESLGRNTKKLQAELARMNANLASNPVKQLVDDGLFTSIVEEFGIDEQSWRRKLASRAFDKFGGIVPAALVNGAKEIYMVPGSETAQAALAATQYGDFVARFTKYNWDVKHNPKLKDMPPRERRKKAVHDALASFIFYNLPQNKHLQYMNDMGPLMFTKFFTRIQPVIGKMFKENPVRAAAVLGLQSQLLASPLDDNIGMYAFMNNGTQKFSANPGDRVNTEILEPALLEWLRWFLPD